MFFVRGFIFYVNTVKIRFRRVLLCKFERFFFIRFRYYIYLRFTLQRISRRLDRFILFLFVRTQFFMSGTLFGSF